MTIRTFASLLWLALLWPSHLLAQTSAQSSAAHALKPPKLTRFVEAPYPEIERGNPRDASVLLTIAVAPDGKPVEVSVAESAGAAFDAAAVDAASQFTFEPAEVDGVAVGVRIQYRYSFARSVAAPPPPEKTSAELTGLVRDRKTQRPMAGVSVELNGQIAVTDAQGQFHFQDVSPGVHTVNLSGAQLTPMMTEEELKRGQKLELAYEVDARAADAPAGQHVDLELVIIDAPVQRSVAATSISADQGARVAGTGGDVIKVVENLPGVARSSVGSASLVVWGASGADTRVYLDDVHIPVLYHEGGFRSVIHSDLVQGVELEPGGYGAAHGRGLGGLVNVALKPLAADGYHGSLALDAIDAAGSLRGNIGEQLRFAVALRRSHLDWLLSKVSSRDVGELVPIPRYWDSQVRLAWVPSAQERIELGGLLSADRISRTVTAEDPAERRRDDKQTSFQRIYLRYERRPNDGSRVDVTPYIGFDRTQVENAFGAVPAQIENKATLVGVRAHYFGRVTDYLSVTTGIDAELQHSDVRRVGSVTSPPREGDVHVFGQTPSDQINADRWRVALVQLAPYVQADLSLFDDQLHVLPGLRVEPTLIQTSRRAPPQGELPALGAMREETSVEPRLALGWALTSILSVRAAVGVYHQPPLAEDLSAVFGNPQLGQAKAMHYLAGANLKLSEAISLEVTGFFARQSELVTRSALGTPQQAEAFVQRGFGRAYGGQVLLRHDLTDRLFGWVSYSFVRSERIDGGLGSYRLFDFDQTHVLTVLASYDLGAGFEVGARFRYATGFPRTPVVDAVYDARSDIYQPVFGAKNGLRIPAYYAFDVRVTKRFKLGGQAELELYLDVQNVTDHRNPEEIVYNFDYSQRSYITGLPILPVMGAKLVW
jgi:TonB family protein